MYQESQLVRLKTGLKFNLEDSETQAFFQLLQQKTNRFGACDRMMKSEAKIQDRASLTKFSHSALSLLISH